MSRQIERGGWRPKAATRSDSGMVTAEIAVALPCLFVVVAVLLWLIGLAVGQGVVVQAAREGARAAARGDSAQQVRERVLDVAPGAQVSLTRNGDLVAVTASAQSAAPFVVLRGMSRRLSATATALVEQP